MFEAYSSAFRAEPKMRWYVLAVLFESVSVATSLWATQLMLTNAFSDQRTRASIILPLQACLLAGSVVGGPLAEACGYRRDALSVWHWKLIVSGSAFGTMTAGVFACLLWGDTSPSVYRMLPFLLVAAFTKLALAPTRSVFLVDLLMDEAVQFDAVEGGARLDDAGAPIAYKKHLLTANSLVSSITVAAELFGLLLGAEVMRRLSGDYGRVFSISAAANVGALITLLVGCRPAASSIRTGKMCPRSDIGDALGLVGATRASIAQLMNAVREMLTFLSGPDRRPLLCLLIGGWMIEMSSDFFDGKMIVMHVLRGSSEHVRHAQIAWSLAGICTMLLLPSLMRRTSRLGQVFIAIVLLNGAAIAYGGRIATWGSASAIVPFAVVMSGESAFAAACAVLTSVTQNSAATEALRSRLAAAWTLFVIISGMGAQFAAMFLAEWLGIPQMLMALGIMQFIVMASVGVLGGPRLWRYGLASSKEAVLQSEHA